MLKWNYSDSGGLTFNGSKTIGSSAGSGVITVNGNSGVILKSGTGGGSGPYNLCMVLQLWEVTTAGFTTGDSNGYYFLNRSIRWCSYCWIGME